MDLPTDVDADEYISVATSSSGLSVEEIAHLAPRVEESTQNPVALFLQVGVPAAHGNRPALSGTYPQIRGLVAPTGGVSSCYSASQLYYEVKTKEGNEVRLSISTWYHPTGSKEYDRKMAIEYRRLKSISGHPAFIASNKQAQVSMIQPWFFRVLGAEGITEKAYTDDPLWFQSMVDAFWSTVAQLMSHRMSNGVRLARYIFEKLQDGGGLSKYPEPIRMYDVARVVSHAYYMSKWDAPFLLRVAKVFLGTGCVVCHGFIDQNRKFSSSFSFVHDDMGHLSQHTGAFRSPRLPAFSSAHIAFAKIRRHGAPSFDLNSMSYLAKKEWSEMFGEPIFVGWHPQVIKEHDHVWIFPKDTRKYSLAFGTFTVQVSALTLSILQSMVNLLYRYVRSIVNNTNMRCYPLASVLHPIKGLGQAILLLDGEDRDLAKLGLSTILYFVYDLSFPKLFSDHLIDAVSCDVGRTDSWDALWTTWCGSHWILDIDAARMSIAVSTLYDDVEKVYVTQRAYNMIAEAFPNKITEFKVKETGNYYTGVRAMTVKWNEYLASLLVDYYEKEPSLYKAIKARFPSD